MVSKSSRAANRPLTIWMNGQFVGTWSRTTTGGDTLEYSQEWIASPEGRPISLTLPFLPANALHSGPHVSAWFENLLPDSPEIRRRIAQRFKVSAGTRTLLAEIGRDCVGAIQILPDGERSVDTKTLTATPLTDEDITRLIRGVTSPSTIGQSDDLDEFRISLAGAQEKTALLHRNGQWFRPDGATPSTHIIKLPLGLVGSMRYDLKHSVENEWLCLQILKAMKFDVANAEIRTFQDRLSDERVLVVERFDRAWSADKSHIIRLPQEDFCQATGTPATNKYENDGGPGIKKCLELLRTGLTPEEDVRTFILCQLAFWLLAAIDGHAKNYSLFLNRNGHLMTPLYDVISAWPIIGTGPDKIAIQKTRMAMALRGKNVHRELDRIKTRHWKILADQSGLNGAFDAMIDLVERAPEAISQVASALPQHFPEVVLNSIVQGVNRQRVRFLGGLPSLA
jgi:serine/threonine-protein kinase HipA